MSDVIFESHIPEITTRIAQVAKERMLEAVQEVRNETLKTLSGSRHGRTYKVPGTNRTYTASAPGEAPAQATAGLRGSIRSTVEGEGKQIVGKVGTDKEYGPMLEYGTHRMAARPWLRKSFEKAEGKVKSIFSKEWLP